MATETASSSPPEPLTRDRVVEYEHYIDRQIDKTRLHVKLVDLGTSLLTLLIALLASLLVLVIVDHWIVGLGFWARVLSAAAILTGGLVFISVRLVPLAFRGINPVYAARSIEQTFPVLKNSLITALLFRSQRGELREVVYRGVEQQAAVGLSKVEVDSAVDRSPIIHLGYALLALMGIWCAYILLSPKNPLQTVARVAAPWREISRPSEVQISDVQPGDTTVYRGQSLEISVLVEGLDDDEYPVVEFSTADGQIVKRSVPMRPDSGLRFIAELSPTENGIWHDVDYRVVAGDAVTRVYRVTALEAPHILVDRVEYDFPAYTELPNEVIPGEGDIRALEGTRVTVHGVANQPIKSGHIELLHSPSADAKPANGASSKQATRVASLLFEERQARVSFGLDLRADRVSPVYSGYRLHFVNTDGVASGQPVQHVIEVIPDLKPVVEILTPSRQTTEIPENARQGIEIRALDPDFSLTKVELRARAKGGSLLQTDLLAEEHVGQAIVTYDFTPSEFGLQAGDEVEYWAIAEDNRLAASGGQPQPNRSATEKHFFRIVAPDPLAEPEPDKKDSAGGQEQPQEGDAAEQGDDNQQSSGNSGDQDGSEGEQSQEGPGQQQEGSEGGEQSDSQNGEGGTSQSQSDRESQQGDASSETEPAGGTDQTSGNESEPAGENGGSESGQGSQESGRGPRDSDEPLPSDGSRDGDVVERIREHMQREKERQEQGTDGSDAQDGSTPEATAGQSERSEESGDSSTPQDGSQEAEGSEQGRDAEGGEPRSESGDTTEGQRGQEIPQAGDAAEQQAQRKQEPGSEGDGADAETGNQRDASDERSGGEQSTESTDRQRPSQDSSAEKSGSDTASDASQADRSGQPDRQPNQTESDPGPSATEKSDGNSQDARSQDSQTQDGQPQDSRSDAGLQEKSSAQEPGESNSQAEGSSSDSSTDAGKDGNSTSDETGEQKSGEAEAGESSPQGSSADDASGEPSNSDRSPQDSQGGNADGSTSRKGTSQGTRESQQGEPGADDPNLEYAKEATDMVLEYLRDQENKPDADLLDKLGWNQDDVKSFLRRWQQMKQNTAEEGQRGARARKELTDVLRSMGLRPPNSMRESSAKNDLLRGMRDTGRRTRPPAEYADQYRAFQKSLATSNDDE